MNYVRQTLAVAFLLGSFQAIAAHIHDPDEDLPLYEYGVGLGFAHFEHYPASDQRREWLLPVPTYQLRGKRLRADDREGAQARLIDADRAVLDIDFGLNPELNSNDNDARRGMPNIPWNFQVGPEFKYALAENLEFRINALQAVLTNFRHTKVAGTLSETQLIWRTFTRFTFGVRFADREYLDTYFAVPQEFASADRPAYGARGGFLRTRVSIYHRWPQGRLTWYLMMNHYGYGLSANRESPLHRTKDGVSVFGGLVYTLGTSSKRAGTSL